MADTGTSIAGDGTTVLPPGYPAAYAFDGLLSDGTPVSVRPIRPDDAPQLIAFHARLSPESIRFRYFAFVPELSPMRAAELTKLDYRGRMAFVAVTDDRIVGVVRYERTDEPSEAEVAFVVADELQGRGVATLMFEHLAHYARAQGIERFVAETLRENDKMLGVFSGIGLTQRLRYDDGVVEAIFDLEPTASYLERRDARDARAVLASLSSLFAPRAIAVVCSESERPGGGRDIVNGLIAGDFAGTVHPVRASGGSVRGIAAAPNLASLGRPVDLVVLDVEPSELLGALDDAAAAGARAVVVVSPLGEADPAAVLARVRRARLRLVGPGSGGVAVTAADLRFHATGLGLFDLAAGGHVGLGAQSAALGGLLLAELNKSGAGVSGFVSLGEKLDVSGNDLLSWFEADPATTVIALHLESFGNPAKFARIASRVGRSKPVVVLRAGPMSRVATSASRTQILSPRPPDPLADPIGALLEQSGVVEVERLDDLRDVVLVLDHCPPALGSRVALLGDAAGPLLLASDACAAAGLSVVAVLESDRDPDPVAALDDSLQRVLAREDVDSVLVVDTRTVDPRDAASASSRARRPRGDKPVVVCAPVSSFARPGALGQLAGSMLGLAVLASPERGALALARATRWAAWRAQVAEPPVEPVGVDRVVVREVLDAALAERPLGGMLDADAAQRLFSALGLSLRGGPSARDGAFETVIRLDHDPSIGPLVSIGLSGVASELLGDRAVAVAPVSAQGARRLIDRLRAAPVLSGWRGADAVDLDALADALCRVGLLGEFAPEVAELALDPLDASPCGVEVGAVELRFAPLPTGPGPLARALRSRATGLGPRSVSLAEPPRRPA